MGRGVYRSYHKGHKDKIKGEGRGGEGTVGRGVYRNYYKGHPDKTKGEGGSREGRWVWLGWSRGMGRKYRQL